MDQERYLETVLLVGVMEDRILEVEQKLAQMSDMELSDLGEYLKELANLCVVEEEVRME